MKHVFFALAAATLLTTSTGCGICDQMFCRKLGGGCNGCDSGGCGGCGDGACANGGGCANCGNANGGYADGGGCAMAPALTAPVGKAASPMDVCRMDRCRGALVAPTWGLKDRRPALLRIPITQLAARATFSSTIRRASGRSSNFWLCYVSRFACLRP